MFCPEENVIIAVSALDGSPMWELKATGPTDGAVGYGTVGDLGYGGDMSEGDGGERKAGKELLFRDAGKKGRGKKKTHGASGAILYFGDTLGVFHSVSIS